jgi:hypothetical protein
MKVTDHVGSCLVRLPLHAAIAEGEIDRVAEAITTQLSGKRSKRA